MDLNGDCVVQPTRTPGGDRFQALATFEARAEECITAARNKEQSAVELQLQQICDGEGAFQPYSEVIRQTVQNLSNGGRIDNRAIAYLMHSVKPLGALLSYLLSKKAWAKHQANLEEHPNEPEFAWSEWLRAGLAKTTASMAAEGIRMGLAKLADALLAGGKVVNKLLCFLVKNVRVQGVVAAALVICVAHAYMVAIGNASELALMSALGAIIAEAAGAAAGIAMSLLGTGILPFVLGLGTTLVVTTLVRYAWTLSPAPRNFTIWMLPDILLRTVGLRGGRIGMPALDLASVPRLDIDVYIYANSLVCSISHDMMVEPATLHGHYFEHRVIKKWVKDRGTNPITRQKAYLTDIRPCATMRRIITDFQAHFNVKTVYTSDLALA